MCEWHTCLVKCYELLKWPPRPTKARFDIFVNKSILTKLVIVETLERLQKMVLLSFILFCVCLCCESVFYKFTRQLSLRLDGTGSSVSMLSGNRANFSWWPGSMSKKMSLIEHQKSCFFTFYNVDCFNVSNINSSHMLHIAPSTPTSLLTIEL